ncbi:MAG: restriction endonuclease [Proteobacteria bacterium]|nr:restriction endonuclease [Pseudomonadota bacterium]
MRLVSEHSHRFGFEAVQESGLLEEVRGFLDAPAIGMAKGAATVLNRHIRSELSRNGWALDARVHPSFNLDINALKTRVGLTVQTGNITRAFYDLIKFEAMHANDRIDAALLILPSRGAASALGSNIANFTRVTNELGLFRHIITVPCLVLGFDE